MLLAERSVFGLGLYVYVGYLFRSVKLSVLHLGLDLCADQVSYGGSM